MQYGLIWYGMVWYGMVLHDVARHRVAYTQSNIIWSGQFKIIQIIHSHLFAFTNIDLTHERNGYADEGTPHEKESRLRLCNNEVQGNLN